MSSDNESFEDRLRRIRDARSETGVPATAGRTRLPHYEPEPDSKAKWLLAYALFGLVCAGAVAVAAAKIGFGPLSALKGVSSEAVAVDATPGLLDQLSSLIFQSSGEGTAGPFAFLPTAPEGWIRVTPEDAVLPTAMDAILARWPHGSVPLAQNAGYDRLVQYLDLREMPDAQQDVLAKTGITGFYLNGEGGFLTLQIKLEPDRKPLGEQNNPSSWIDGLVAIEQKAIQPGEILERLTLGGIEVTNQTKAAGKSLIMRPIGSDLQTINGLKIAVPLTSRAVLRVEGLAAPVFAQGLITSIDRDALAALQD